ncbi:MAG: single-stranded DNA-binding protein [Treponema sp.]|nr:single-stranded DNA-binding protein [Treponema sp.]MBQ2551482.1 single-stranded DNA-binding protein [Treponema sp.]MBQ4235607.1 single-stranded DNA-binding protein [Treponema sp.]MBQ5384722.1 single-stranded DNA-binding protein [Treponema sp.]
MNAINQIIIEGNVVRQPEKKQGLSFSTCTFPIAVNRTIKMPDGKFSDEVSFFEIDAFGNLAESTCKYAVKGRGIRVVGHLKQNRWKDEEGKSHNKVKIIAEHVEYKPVYKKSGENQQPGSQQNLAMIQEAAEAAMQEAAEQGMTF